MDPDQPMLRYSPNANSGWTGEATQVSVTLELREPFIRPPQAFTGKSGQPPELQTLRDRGGSSLQVGPQGSVGWIRSLRPLSATSKVREMLL